MSVATMLQPRASRASTSSSGSYQPVTRQNTLSSSHDGRSARQSKRISVTALYLSMSAKDRDLEISDDLAKGKLRLVLVAEIAPGLNICSTKVPP